MPAPTKDLLRDHGPRIATCRACQARDFERRERLAKRTRIATVKLVTNTGDVIVTYDVTLDDD